MRLADRVKRIVTPSDYYVNELAGCRPSSAGWRVVRCPFHDDSSPSLAIHIASGGFFCHGCGAKGGDIIDFEVRRSRLPFNDAVRRIATKWGVKNE